ncbi:hypothetical protein OPQ81_002639 [Rhizoctonia solani]|nr:hypothetical protein OPQ81_002639 [Rhizoctonia solani]
MSLEAPTWVDHELQCLFCLKVFDRPGLKKSHQTQVGHNDSEAPTPNFKYSSQANQDAAPILISDDVTMCSPSPEVVDNIPPIHIPEGNVFRFKFDFSSPIILNPDLAPFGFATSQEELATRLHSMLEDIIQKKVIPNQNSPDAPAQHHSTSPSINTENSDKFVWMQDLHAGIDQALEEFFNETIEKEARLIASDDEQDDHQEDEVFHDT